MTLPHIAASVLSLPVALVGTLGTVLALTFDPTVTAAAIVTVLVALTAAIVAILTKLGDTKIKLAEIAHSVDGVASHQVDKVSALEARNADLTAQLAEARNVASTLAATHAMVSVAHGRGGDAVPSLSPPFDPTAGESLKQIDKNTKDTANNTERVQADVQDLKDKG